MKLEDGGEFFQENYLLENEENNEMKEILKVKKIMEFMYCKLMLREKIKKNIYVDD